VQYPAVLGERENKNEKRSCPFEKGKQIFAYLYNIV